MEVNGTPPPSPSSSLASSDHGGRAYACTYGDECGAAAPGGVEAIERHGRGERWGLLALRLPPCEPSIRQVVPSYYCDGILPSSAQSSR